MNKLEQVPKQEPKHPLQPIIKDANGIYRFKKNSIVEFLADDRMNELAQMDFPDEDREQFAQLIGYSLCVFSSLSYTSDEAYQQALLSLE